MAEAHHGAKVRVPTPDAPVNMKVPEGSAERPGRPAAWQGRRRKGRTPGDLYVHFLVHIPTKGESGVDEAHRRLAKFQTEDPRTAIHL